MKDKIVVITGGSAGIGFETAKAIAQMGAEIILVARNEKKLKQAIEQLTAKTGNPKIKYYIGDFASQKSIKKTAAQIKKDHPVIDVLINNAGGVFPEFKLTEDGLETTIAVNHYAYFLLTNLLLDNIKKSSYARIVNVASDSHYNGKIDFDSFTTNKSYFITKAYAQSKLANVLFTFYLADRLQGTNVTINCLHPGFVKTDIGNKGTQWYASLFWTLASRLGAISVEAGAKTSVYLATSPQVEKVTGKYFDKCLQKAPSPIAHNKELQKQLWQISEKLCPLS